MEYWGCIRSANRDFFMGRKITIIYIIGLFSMMDHIKKIHILSAQNKDRDIYNKLKC